MGVPLCGWRGNEVIAATNLRQVDLDLYSQHTAGDGARKDDIS
jgi:hypothetical protein